MARGAKLQICHRADLREHRHTAFMLRQPRSYGGKHAAWGHQHTVAHAMLALVTAGLLALTQPTRARASPQQCTAGQKNDFTYSEVFAPERRASHAAFRDLPGFTRSTYQANYALVTPESRVWLPNEDWPGCKTSHIISRATPAHFSMFLVEMKACALACSLLRMSAGALCSERKAGRTRHRHAQVQGSFELCTHARSLQSEGCGTARPPRPP